uniref:Dipeptidyl-peptidase IV n=1 Tax=Denticeps clupeoides TaxID=299321 RepID=A0AAY4BWH9_9TELE
MGCGKVFLGVVGLIVVITLISVPVAIYLNRDHSASKRLFTFADYFNDTIRYKKYGVYWISDSEYLHKAKDGNVFLHNVETRELSLFLSNTTFVRRSEPFCSSVPPRCSAEPYPVQYLAFAPTGNMLAYVWRYNIYLKQSAATAPIQVTQNGEENRILNGVPDWAYEEEVFASSEAMWWSTTGKFLAYLELNDTSVHTIDYPWFGSGQYPETIAIPYPKAGSTIPKAKLFVIDSANPLKPFPELVLFYDHYLSSVTWVTDERVAVQWLKRRQNHVLLQIYDFDGSNWTKFEQMSKTGWIGQYNPARPFFAEDKISFYRVMSDSKGYKHIHYITNAMPITSGTWEVMYISKLTSSAIYFISNEHMGRPEIQILEDNSELESILKEASFPTDLWYQMMLPPNFDKSKKYPLLIYVYGGPASQTTDFSFRLGWSTYLASTEGVIVANFDGRGSGYQGDEVMHAIYQRLGTYEVEDQISAVRKFIDMGFIDTERIAIWGWSYGGYVTSMALGAGTGLFKCGIAVAPVAKWDYYDAVYTERYMSRPDENVDGYKNSTVMSRAKNFQSVEYLLIHGTADDNVHFQQAAQISKALVDEKVDFEAMWYTDKDHTLAGSARYHVYNHMTHFLQKCFAKTK